MIRLDKNLLALAGEYRVCSELLKRGVFATITYGNQKSADVYVIGPRDKPAKRIEVKTSQKPKFVTRLSQKQTFAKGADAPDFWVLVYLERGENGAFSERFFVLAHDQIFAVQAEVNRAYAKDYRERKGKDFDFEKKGVDGFPLSAVEPYEGKWKTITNS